MSATHRSKRVRGLAPWNPKGESAVIVGQVQQVLREYRDHLPMTGRQIFYRLVGAHGYSKTEAAYKSLLEKLVRARRAGIIPWEAIRDDGVTIVGGGGYQSIESWGRTIARSAEWFELDKMLGQPQVIEVWVEAAGMVPQIERVAEPYGCQVYSSGGFNSVTMKHDTAQRIISRYEREQRATVMLHIGDHDPSGVSIYTNLEEDLASFIDDYGYESGELFTPVRIAVTQDQADEYSLDSAPPKSTDSRSANWEGETYQVEAMTPDQLATEVRQAIEEHHDFEALELITEREEGDRERLQTFISTIDFSSI